MKRLARGGPEGKRGGHEGSQGEAAGTGPLRSSAASLPRPKLPA